VTVKAKRNGDCFFDSVCKAFAGRHVERNSAMWQTTFGGEGSSGGGVPPHGELTIGELRKVVAAHYDESMWLMGQAVGGDYFAFIVDDSLELTQANIAALADDASDRAYWADESAIAAVQRYLHTRLLIFKPTADPANRCACVGDVGATRTPLFVVLRHSHRASKEQHYELYALPGTPQTTVFDAERLPAGVKRAFASTCPDADRSWREASDPAE